MEAHSLLQDIRRFNVWADGTTTIGPVDGVMSMTQDVPPEEAFESLASRCRPFLLQGDPIHWAAVFKSLRDSWAAADAAEPDTGFAVVRPDEMEKSGNLFATLADSWLSGDLVPRIPPHTRGQRAIPSAAATALP